MIKRIECDKCHGLGTMACPVCDGTDVDEQGNPCSYCAGLGAVLCDKCDGNGAYDVEVDDIWGMMD